jgi:Poly(ADP-ribose) polymerase and DNA-Ligase Zn-finger region
MLLNWSLTIESLPGTCNGCLSMPHVIEPASSGRSQCRGCGRKIERGELRFGERRENDFGEGEMTLWFHPLCAAYKRPQALLELLDAQHVDDAQGLSALAQRGIEHERLPRLNGAGRSPTGRANCRSCHKPIEKGAWRLLLTFFEEVRFNAGGFIHAGCAQEYFGTTDLLEQIRHFSPELTAADMEELAGAIKRAA